MSSLVFFTDPTQVVVATDTLAVDPNGKPMLFSSKAHYLPHLRTIIAGTGMGMFSGDWAMEVNNRMVLEGILNLDYHTPKALQARWTQYVQEFGLLPSATTTVYHFGLSEDDRSVVAFAYRSTTGFKSERLPPGLAVKPECQVPEGNNLLELIPQIMNAQRQAQSHVPSDARIYIGGEIVVMHLTSSGCSIFQQYSFHDFVEDRKHVLQRHAGVA